MKYQKPLNEADENASYVDMDANAGIEGSDVPAAAIEQPMREIVNVQTAAGIVAVDGDTTQLAAAITVLIADAINGVGGTSTYVAITTSQTYNIPAGYSIARFHASAGSGGGGMGSVSMGQAGDGGNTTVTGPGVAIIANGGKGGLGCQEGDGLRNGIEHGTATGGDINIKGGGVPGGRTGLYGGSPGSTAGSDGGNGAMAIKTVAVNENDAFVISIGAGGAGLVGGAFQGADGVQGYVIVELW